MPEMSTRKGEEHDRSEPSSANGRPEADPLVKETERLLANTREFLERLEQGEEATRKYVEQVKETLENDLRRLKRDRREADKGK